MKKIYYFILYLSLLEFAFGYGDTLFYNLSVYGLKCGELSYTSQENNRLTIKTNSSGLINYIFPFKNEYDVLFDSSTFIINNYSKNIKQGEFKQKLKGEWNPSTNSIEYENLSSFKRPNPCLSIFSFLFMLNQKSYKYLDTKWFDLEHEGNLFKSRVLLSESVNLTYNGKSISSHHFRFDLIPKSNTIKMLNRTDYFSQNITHPEAIKQIWVSKAPKKKILKASVKIGIIEIIATLK